MEELLVEHLSLRFPEMEKAVLHDVSFSLRSRSVTLVCGPNGSGKSVLLRACLGLERTATGSVRLDSVDVFNDPKSLYRRSAVVFQNPETQIFGTTVAEEIAFSLGPHRVSTSRDEDILRRLGIADLLDRAPASLSGGQRQRLALAGAFLAHPDILFLDEPISALDYPFIRELADIIREARNEGTAIFATVHDVRDLWPTADQVLLLNEGRTVYSGDANDSIPYLTPQYGMRPVEECVQ